MELRITPKIFFISCFQWLYDTMEHLLLTFTLEGVICFSHVTLKWSQSVCLTSYNPSDFLQPSYSTHHIHTMNQTLKGADGPQQEDPSARSGNTLDEMPCINAR